MNRDNLNKNSTLDKIYETKEEKLGKITSELKLNDISIEEIQKNICESIKNAEEKEKNIDIDYFNKINVVTDDEMKLIMASRDSNIEIMNYNFVLNKIIYHFCLRAPPGGGGGGGGGGVILNNVISSNGSR